jgi:hypothetical protein
MKKWLVCLFAFLFLSCSNVGLGCLDTIKIKLTNNSAITLWWKTHNQGGAVQPYKSESVVLWYDDVLSYFVSGSLISKEILITQDVSNTLIFTYDKTSDSFIIE